MPRPHSSSSTQSFPLPDPLLRSSISVADSRRRCSVHLPSGRGFRDPHRSRSDASRAEEPGLAAVAVPRLPDCSRTWSIPRGSATKEAKQRWTASRARRSTYAAGRMAIDTSFRCYIFGELRAKTTSGAQHVCRDGIGAVAAAGGRCHPTCW